MKRKFKQLVSAGLAITMMISLTACGGSQKAETQAAGQTETADTSAETTPQNAEVVLEGQPENWTEADATESVVFQDNAMITTLDRWSATSNDTTFAVDYLVFDGLLSKDSDGKAIPWLAESYEMSDDYSYITYHLRDDVYFTNGEKLTADDVIFTFERLRDDKEHLPDSTSKSWRNYLGEIEKTDDQTVVMHFVQSMPEFWSLVTLPSAEIFSKKAFEEAESYEEFWKHPVGSGPYTVTSFDPANSITELELRTDEHGYWGYDYLDTYTNVKHITIKYSPEATTRISSLRTGEADIVNNVPTTDVPSLKQEGYTVQYLPPTTYMFLQTASAAGDTFENRDLREALSLSIDRNLIVQALMDGLGTPVEYPCLTTDLGYRESDKNYTYDKEKAKSLVEASGYNGESVKLIYTPSVVAIAPELCQAIQSMAGEVGINIEVVPLEEAVYNEARLNHDFDICLCSTSRSGNMWFKTAAEIVGNDRFNTGFQNEELKSLGKELQSVMDEEKQDEILAKMYDIELTDFAPNIYLYWPSLVFSWNKNIQGIEFHQYRFADMRFMVKK